MRISSEIVRVCKNDLYNHSNVQFPPIQNEIFHNFLINNFRMILFNNKNPLIHNSISTIPFVPNYDMKIASDGGKATLKRILKITEDKRRRKEHLVSNLVR